MWFVSFGIRALAAAFLLSCSTLASAQCIPAEAQHYSATKVVVDPGKARVGEPIVVTWSFAGSPIHGAAPTFLIVKVMPSIGVRFDGRGFFALAAKSQNPKGISYGLGEVRAVVPLHSAFSQSSGRIEIVPSTADRLQLEWSVVGSTSCGEWTAAKGASPLLAIGAGTARIAPRDEFGDAKPQKLLLALNGRYQIQEFKDRYEVYDAGSGALVLRREGRSPNFSPSGRFLTARLPSLETFEVIDLDARVVVGRYLSSLLGWSHDDSFLYVVGAREAWFSIVRTLHGRRADVALTQLPIKGFDGATSDEEIARLKETKLPDQDIEAERPVGSVSNVAYAEWDFDLSLTDGVVFIAPLNGGEDDKIEIVAHDLGAANEKQPVGTISTDNVATFTKTIGLERPKLAGWNVGEPISISDKKFQELLMFSDRTSDKDELRDLLQQFAVRPMSKAGAAGPPDRNAPSGKGRSLLRRSAVRLTRQSGDQSHTGVIGASLPHQSHRDIKGVRSSKDKARMLEIGREIAKLYTPDVATFTDKRIVGSYKTPAFVDPSIPRMKLKTSGADNNGTDENDGPVEFNFGDPGRDLWRFTIGSTVYWLTQTVESGRNGHIFSFTLLSSSKEANSRFADLIAVANGPEGHKEGWLRAPFSQAQLGDMRDDLREPFAGFSVVGVSGERYLTIATQPIPRIIAFDLTRWSLACAIASPVDGATAVTVVMHDDARHLTQVNSDGAVHVYSCADGRAVMSGAYVDDELVMVSPAGYFDGSEDAAAYIEIAVAGLPGRHVLSQFAPKLRRPGVTQDVLLGRAIEEAPVLALPPLLKLVAPNRLEAFSPNGVGYIQLYADGRPVRQSKAEGNEHRMVVPELAEPQGRQLTAFAVDRIGIVSPPLVLAHPKAASNKAGHLFSLAVGVDKYSGIRDLKLAVADAKRITKAVAQSKLYAKKTQVLLTDKAATKESILAQLDSLVDKAGAEDTIVAFFAAHGVPNDQKKLHIALSSTKLDDIAGTSLAFEHVADKLKRAKARAIVLLDVCHAGLADRDRIASNDDAVTQLVTQSGSSMIVFAASKGRQESEELDKGGLFSVAFDAVITTERKAHDLDGNGAISVAELYRALKAKVVRSSSGRQTPWLARNLLVGDFDIF